MLETSCVSIGLVSIAISRSARSALEYGGEGSVSGNLPFGELHNFVAVQAEKLHQPAPPSTVSMAPDPDMLFDPVGQRENRPARVGVGVRHHERRTRVRGGAEPWIEGDLGPDGYAGFLFEAFGAVTREEFGHMAALWTRMADHVCDQRDCPHGGLAGHANGL